MVSAMVGRLIVIETAIEVAATWLRTVRGNVWADTWVRPYGVGRLMDSTPEADIWEYYE